MLSEISPSARAIAETDFSQAVPQVGETVDSEAARASLCPSVLHPTPAPDGVLSRLRVVGGLLTAVQAEAIAQFADRFSQGRIQITNRANIQIRGQQALPPEARAVLQSLGLASRTAEVDHLRNIMLSPTAGIDVQSLWDPRPVAHQWEAYLADHPELAILSAKFSIGFDGGEAATISDRPNDISLIATMAEDRLNLRLRLSLGDRGRLPRMSGFNWPQIKSCLPLRPLLRFTTTIRSGKMRRVLPDCENCCGTGGWRPYCTLLPNSCRCRGGAVRSSRPLPPSQSTRIWVTIPSSKLDYPTGAWPCPWGRLPASNCGELSTWRCTMAVAISD